MGLAFIILGTLLIIASMFVPTGIENSELTSEKILNVGLLQNQLMLFQAGLAVFVTGAIVGKRDADREDNVAAASHRVDLAAFCAIGTLIFAAMLGNILAYTQSGDASQALDATTGANGLTVEEMADAIDEAAATEEAREGGKSPE